MKQENDYYCKAIDSLGRRLFIVSPDLRILAGLAQGVVGWDLLLCVLEEDVFAGVAGDLEGGHHVAGDGLGP